MKKEKEAAAEVVSFERERKGDIQTYREREREITSWCFEKMSIGMGRSLCAVEAVGVLASIAVIVLLCNAFVVLGQEQPSEAECVADVATQGATLNSFLFTLITGTCDLTAGLEHVCSDGCKQAISGIAATSKGCLQFDSFGGKWKQLQWTPEIVMTW